MVNIRCAANKAGDPKNIFDLENICVNNDIHKLIRMHANDTKELFLEQNQNIHRDMEDMKALLQIFHN